MNDPRTRRIALALVIVTGLGLVALALWQNLRADRIESKTVTPAVMGTTTRLIGVGRRGTVWAAVQAAEAEARAVEKLMSRHDPDSPLSRFNAAPADQDFALDEKLLAVMRFGQALAEKTGGAFDVTMWPLGQVWSAGKAAGRPPDQPAIEEALARVGHRKLVVGPSSARKTVAGMSLSLDAIAKGYAVDRAIEAMQGAGLAGGLVELGGDVRCFGRPARRGDWRIGIQNPFGEGYLKVLGPIDAAGHLAVCTSGNYRRFVEIEGRRYSHILDPRTGQPADAVPSVTVIAPDALAADGWATALSVLGIAEGLRLVESEPGLEAMWITGSADRFQFHYSSGFGRYVRE